MQLHLGEKLLNTWEKQPGMYLSMASSAVCCSCLFTVTAWLTVHDLNEIDGSLYLKIT